ncbi:hypothetical protein M8818_005934 [Zalaria obscura]|uniref:Uncharacterized protein n=1 Tax=Zalaria obscura TaxID=2024903 RepID=A0ACC3S7H3_9PEZI
MADSVGTLSHASLPALAPSQPLPASTLLPHIPHTHKTPHPDRVFGHALNTINKIRTGSTKPPVSDRLALYGLYKQSMEGSVRYIQSRPLGTDPQSLKEQEKYDAWASNEGLSRTEAKKRYIEKLIATMHSYASETQEARELVGELEFVWEQVRNNSQPSTGSEKSSPLMVQEGGAGGYMGAATSSVGGFETGRGREGGEGSERREGKLRVLSPVSQEREDEEEEKEEFVDAPVSQFGEQDIHTPSEERIEGLGPLAGEGSAAAQPRRSAPEDARWRRRVEGALIKMTTEVAAPPATLSHRMGASWSLVPDQAGRGRSGRSLDRHSLSATKEGPEIGGRDKGAAGRCCRAGAEGRQPDEGAETNDEEELKGSYEFYDYYDIDVHSEIIVWFRHLQRRSGQGVGKFDLQSSEASGNLGLWCNILMQQKLGPFCALSSGSGALIRMHHGPVYIL